MSTRTTLIVAGLLILAGVILSLSVYNRLPDPMASHWNLNDEVDGTISRPWGAFLMPILAAFLTGLLLLVPHIDPLKANIASFRGAYNAFVIVMLVFLLYLHKLTLLWNLGYQDFQMSRVLLPAIGLIFVFAGLLMARSRRNFFIGIRTPWTLSSDTVWEKTHRLGSRLFIAIGLVVVLAGLVGTRAVVLIPALIAVAVLVPVVYSYILYRREAHL